MEIVLRDLQLSAMCNLSSFFQVQIHFGTEFRLPQRTLIDPFLLNNDRNKQGFSGMRIPFGFQSIAEFFQPVPFASFFRETCTNTEKANSNLIQKLIWIWWNICFSPGTSRALKELCGMLNLLLLLWFQQRSWTTMKGLNQRIYMWHIYSI